MAVITSYLIASLLVILYLYLCYLVGSKLDPTVSKLGQSGLGLAVVSGAIILVSTVVTAVSIISNWVLPYLQINQ